MPWYWEAPWSLHRLAMRLRERRVFRRNAVPTPVDPEAYYRSAEWEAKALIVKQSRPWCAVCNKDYRKKGLGLEGHHLPEGYKNFGHESPKHIIPLCSNHHPKGQYPLWQIRRDRRRYLWRKYRLWLFPPYWAWSLVRSLYAVATGRL